MPREVSAMPAHQGPEFSDEWSTAPPADSAARDRGNYQALRREALRLKAVQIIVRFQLELLPIAFVLW